MKIKFCGAAQFVTGSSHLIILDNGYKILLDCGLFQGKGKKIWEWNNEWMFDPADIDCLILSHAHIDHSGRIPKLVKDGFRGAVYATHATRSLCNIMLLDSAMIQERDVEWFNKKNRKAIHKGNKKHRIPLYRQEDIPETMRRFITSGYEQWVRIAPGVSVMFRDAGHILGSASITLKIEEGGKETLLGFTGDIGRPERPILRDPMPMPEVDFLIAESTYGDRLHEGNPDQKKRLLEVIKGTCVNKRGKLIIPAFSVGRTQEIVYMMDQMAHDGLLPRVNVYVDSPLAVNATAIYGDHPECYDADLVQYLLTDADPFGFNSLHYIHKVEDSKALNDKKEPGVIISASGMANAGRIRHHISNNVEDFHNTILIVGYCSPGTTGRWLRDGAQVIKLFGEWKKVEAGVEVMDSFSAHGDYREMLAFLRNQTKRVKQLFLVHGEPETQEIYRKKLLKMGFGKVNIPARGQVFNLH